jgi:large subunit ribosomal protein L10
VNRDEKAASVAELRERFSKASVALVASNLRAAGGEFKVAKHTLGKIAMQETRYARCGSLLVGPRGLVFGYTDPVAVAKALVDFAEQHAKLQIDGGAVEGQVIAADGVKALARMPALPALQALIARQALSPGSRIASSVQAPAQRLAGAVKALITKLEEAGGA